MPFTKGHAPFNYWQGKKRPAETKQKIKVKLKTLYANPKDHPQYIGKIKRSGYWYVYSLIHPFRGKQNYVAEHRLVIEKSIGRFLTPKETVHHINGIKTDNRLENLELFASRGEHTKQRHSDLFERQRIEFKGKHFSPNTEFKPK